MPHHVPFLRVAVAAMALAASPAMMTAQSTELSADVRTVDGMIAALYDVISGPAGQARNWDRFRGLFAPEARLIPTGPRADGTHGYRAMSAEQYVTTAGASLERDGFFESELGRMSETFGNIVHVFSAYDSKRTLQDKAPFARGINSIQLLNDGKRYWILNVVWDSERPDNPIPSKYLNRKP